MSSSRKQPARAFSTDEIRPMHSSANSDDSPCCSKTKSFHIEFSDLHISKEDSIKPWCDQLACQLFKAEYLADEDSKEGLIILIKEANKSVEIKEAVVLIKENRQQSTYLFTIQLLTRNSLSFPRTAVTSSTDLFPLEQERARVESSNR
jgi:hypothetical protein